MMAAAKSGEYLGKRIDAWGKCQFEADFAILVFLYCFCVYSKLSSVIYFSLAARGMKPMRISIVK